MILIAHRGNIYGPNPERENSPSYITDAINAGFHVEVDVWFKVHSDGCFFLGHDEPQYQVPLDFIKHDKIICHAKTIETLQILIGYGIHCFFHDRDEATLTSRGKIWLYPGVPPCSSGILVMPEWPSLEYEEGTWLDFIVKLHHSCYGVCSDNVGLIRDSLK